MNKIIEIHLESLSFQNKSVLNSLHFSFKKGEKIAIIGESGSGKSTLLKWISGYLKPASIKASLTLFSQKLSPYMNQRTQEQKKLIGYIDQDYYSSLDEQLKIKQTLKEVFFQYHYSKIKSKFISYCEHLSLDPSILEKFPSQLSGGMRQCVFIAISLMRNIEILCIDEAISALNSSLREKVLNFIFSEAEYRNLTIFIVDHYFYLIEPYMDQVLLINQGRIIEKLKKNTKQKHFSFYSTLGKSFQKGLCSIKKKSYPIKEKEVILEVKNLSYQYPNQTSPVLKEVSFSLYNKEIIGFKGKSGVGKTTLSHCLIGLKNFEGQIFYQGSPLINLKDFSYIQPVFQQTWSSFLVHMTLRKQLHLYLNKGDGGDKIRHYLRELSLSVDLLDRYPYQLSGGECQRFSFVRSLLLHPKILILDEPTASLDLILKKKLIDLCLYISKRLSISMIIFSHDQEFLNLIASQVFFLEEGGIKKQ